MASEFSRVANAGINVIIGLATAVFVLVLFGIILYSIANNSNAPNASNLVSQFFDPIQSNWNTVALLIMLGAAVIIILPVINRIRGATTGAA